MNVPLHNSRVLHLMSLLMETFSSEAAVQWLLTHNVALDAKPIDIVDTRYDDLVRIAQQLISGRPL